MDKKTDTKASPAPAYHTMRRAGGLLRAVLVGAMAVAVVATLAASPHPTAAELQAPNKPRGGSVDAVLRAARAVVHRLLPEERVHDFSIQLEFRDPGLPDSIVRVFEDAAERWSKVIRSDFPNWRAKQDIELNACGESLNVPRGFFIDDLLILVHVGAIDGVGGTLGQAGPCLLDAVPAHGSSATVRLPRVSRMEFDRDDVDKMLRTGILDDVILHEMGHALGFGVLWSSRGFVLGEGSSNPVYTGPNGRSANLAIGGTGLPLVANTGGSGTRDAHWRESVYGVELMSPVIGSGKQPMSKLTIMAMADLGYAVDPLQADDFSVGDVPAGGQDGGGGGYGDDTLPVPDTPVDDEGSKEPWEILDIDEPGTLSWRQFGWILLGIGVFVALALQCYRVRKRQRRTARRRSTASRPPSRPTAPAASSASRSATATVRAVLCRVRPGNWASPRGRGGSPRGCAGVTPCFGPARARRCPFVCRGRGRCRALRHCHCLTLYSSQHRGTTCRKESVQCTGTPVCISCFHWLH